MPCPICGNDGPNCDCSPVVRRMHADAEELLDRVAALEEAVPRWIPVAERLPEFGVRVLGFWMSHRGAVQSVRGAVGGWLDDGGIVTAPPSHWMPLPPDPPQEEKP